MHSIPGALGRESKKARSFLQGVVDEYMEIAEEIVREEWPVSYKAFITFKEHHTI